MSTHHHLHLKDVAARDSERNDFLSTEILYKRNEPVRSLTPGLSIVSARKMAPRETNLRLRLEALRPSPGSTHKGSTPCTLHTQEQLACPCGEPIQNRRARASALPTLHRCAPEAPNRFRPPPNAPSALSTNRNASSRRSTSWRRRVPALNRGRDGSRDERTPCC